MKKTLQTVTLLGLTVLAVPASAQTWPQLQANPQHTGYTPACPEPPYRVAWQWSPMTEGDYLSRVAQPVATEDTVFMPTLGGMLYALDARAEDQPRVKWKARIGQGCFHSAAFCDGRVFAASLDGDVAAFAMDTGKELWRTQAPGPAGGFVTAPVLAEGRAFLGNLGGNLLAISQPDGKIAWKIKLGAPILQTCAWNDGRVYVGAQDMRLRSLDARSGAVLWTSDQLAGMSLEHFHVVVHRGCVIVRTMLPARELGWGGGPLSSGAPAAEWTKFLTEHPEYQDMHILDEKTGKEVFKVPQEQIMSMNGPIPPPSVDRDGRLIVPVQGKQAGKDYDLCTWATLDLSTRAISILKGPVVREGNLPKQAAGGSPDETVSSSCGGRIVFVTHAHESNANFTGYYDPAAQQWWSMTKGAPQGRPQDWQKGGYRGPNGNFRGSNGNEAGGLARAITANRLYHHAFDVLAAWESAAPKP